MDKPQPDKPIYQNDTFQSLPSDELVSGEWTLDEASFVYKNHHNSYNRPFRNIRPTHPTKPQK